MSAEWDAVLAAVEDPPHRHQLVGWEGHPVAVCLSCHATVREG